jgi:nucleotide-binding universal stress UspA family protein
MHELIVPIDFSEASKNAARYAAWMSKGIPAAQLTLYNVFGTLELGSDGSPIQSDDGARKTIMELALQSVANDISGISDARISCVAEEDDDFPGSLAKYVLHFHPELIIMGITGATRLAKIFMGSNTLKIVRRNIAPTVIVPPDAVFRPVQNVLFISDFKNVDETIPFQPIRNFLGLFHPVLHIVNVDSEHYVELTEEFKEQRARLHRQMEDFEPEYYFIRMFDFMDAINQFVEDKKIDIIVTVPKNQSFFANLFKTTHTSRLAYHSHVPIATFQALRP